MAASAAPHAQDASRTEPTLPMPAPVSTNGFLLSSPTSTAGIKRPASSLLPAFEPSSPALPRPLKRQNTGNAQFKYPTPMPTSSTGIASSPAQKRPGLVRTMTAASEREPLGQLPTVDLPENSEWLLMGRSSNSSHYQLSANRLVSRVHAKARFVPAASLLEPNKIEIMCNGWNGMTLHSQGKSYELAKGDSFTSESEGTEIMMDVQDARIVIRWPRRVGDGGSPSDSSWEDSPRRPLPSNSLQSSPLRRKGRLASPESPTPAGLSSSTRLQDLFANEDSSIKIFEDDSDSALPAVPMDPNVSMQTEVTASFTSELSDPDQDENDPDEENDPVVHSFGPFGANISNRFASISTRSPKISQSPAQLKGLVESSSTESLSPAPSRDIFKQTPIKSEDTSDRDDTPTPAVHVSEAVTNHVINQLAYSRLSSTPLSAILANLPGDHREGLTKEALRVALVSTICIGTIERQGKDAAGKALESEYYYLPEKDDDENRRAVVDGLRKPSLRNCRKQHKQYYWKRPRTP